MTVQSTPSRRSFLQGGAMLAGGLTIAGPLLAACGTEGSSNGSVTEGQESLSMQLGWLLGSSQLGEALALAKGYYRDNGIDFSMRPGGPSIEGVSIVAAGKASLGQEASSPAMMLAQSQGRGVKTIAAGLQKHPFTYFSKPDKPVNEPQDLVGKTIGTQTTATALLYGLLAANDIDPKSVKIVTVGNDVTPLVSGQVDVWTGWKTSVGSLKPLGSDYVSMMLWDAGIQLYANPYYATGKVLSSTSTQLEKFIAATATGWKDALDDPEAAVDALVTQAPSLRKEDLMAEATEVLQYAFTETTATGGWGTMDRGLWQTQVDQWSSLGQFEDGKTPTVDDVMTLDILEATAADRPKAG